MEFSRNINSSGSDLLHLITDILDLSRSSRARSPLKSNNSPSISCATTSNAISVTWRMPRICRLRCISPTICRLSWRRLQAPAPDSQEPAVNAVKFTTHGHVEVRVALASEGWSPDHPVLSQARRVVAFVVEDPVSAWPRKAAPDFRGLPAGRRRHLAQIWRHRTRARHQPRLASLLGREIRLLSRLGEGSTFTLFPAGAVFRPGGPDQLPANGTANICRAPQPFTALPTVAGDPDSRTTAATSQKMMRCC